MYTSLIKLDRSSAESLQKQIRRQMVLAIVNRRVPIDRPLPSIRKLAHELEVSVTTIALAYETMKLDGFVESRDRSGFYIVPDAVATFDGAVAREAEENCPPFEFAPQLGGRVFDTPGVARPQDALARYEYPFLCGLIDPDLFPVAQWRECAHDAASTLELKNWAADYSLQDDQLLVDQLIQHVLPPRGIIARPDEILITTGSQNGAYLAIKLLLAPGQKIGFEEPGYPDAFNMAHIERLVPVSLRHGTNGIIYDDAARECACLYLTPSHQFPTNQTMPAQARRELLEQTQAAGQFIIEDDCECEITYHAPLPPAIRSLDRRGSVVYISAVTDSLISGLRIGFMVAHPDVISQARILRHHVIRHPSANNQRNLALFIQRGYMARLTANLNKEYAKRCDTALEAIRAYFPELPVAPTRGGSALWIRLPDGVDVEELRQSLLGDSVYLETGTTSFMNTHTAPPFIRLGFSVIPRSRIASGVKIVGDRIKAMLKDR